MAMQQAESDVLIVDDDVHIREMLTELLEDEGYRVAGASNGQEALRYLRHSGSLPRLILLDLNMPVMSGWEFRAEQAQDRRLMGIPVVIISASGSAEMLASRLAAQAYLSKPLNFKMLLRLIAQYVNSAPSYVPVPAIRSR